MPDYNFDDDYDDSYEDAQDDFEIIEEDEATGVAFSNPWLLVGIILLIAIFAFTVGIAFTTLSDRLARSEPSTQPSQAIALADTTGTPSSANNITTTPEQTDEPTPTTTPTPTSTTTPTSTPTPACTQQIAESFMPYYSADRFGCAHSSANTIWAAWEPFERGAMLWRSDTDAAYVVIDNTRWFQIDERWQGQQPRARGNPPPGLQAPARGFGYVWSVSDDIFSALGWATDAEKGFCAIVQEFERGFILQSNPVDSCTPENLYNHATAADWQPLTLALAQTQTERNDETPAVSSSNRPTSTDRSKQNVKFNVPKRNNIQVDGNLNEWSGRWLPITAIISGRADHAGPGDLSATFQPAWSNEGLYLAIRVNDDLYRGGPDGTDMWQGDSIEIHFDRDLSGDANTTTAKADDYQLGVSFGPNQDQLRTYRWLPVALEGNVGLHGAFILTPQGYEVEVLIPWNAVELPQDQARQGAKFGFALSINDNDGDTPAQQTVISSASARTTHDNPAEWGTVHLKRN